MEEQFALFWVIPHTKVELVPTGAYYRKADFGSMYVRKNFLKEWSTAGPLETGELLSIGDTRGDGPGHGSAN